MPKRVSTEAPQISLFARVDSYDVRSSLGLNVSLLGHLRDNIADDTEVFESTTQLIVRGVLYEPHKRSGERIEVTLYGKVVAGLSLKVGDIHAQDKHYRNLYRTYRGEQAPILNMPTGITAIERRRHDRVWAAWVFVEPRLVTDMLMILSSGKLTYLSIYEKRADRRRWITDLTLQTANPAED